MKKLYQIYLHRVMECASAAQILSSGMPIGARKCSEDQPHSSHTTQHEGNHHSMMISLSFVTA